MLILMKKNQKSQTGFGLIEALLLIIAVAIVAFVCYYVWRSQKQADKTLNQAASTSQTSPVLAKKTTAKTTTPAHTPQQAVTFAQNAYNTYKQASANPSTGEPTGRSASLDAIKADLTSSFYDQVKAKYAIPTEVNGHLNPDAVDYDMISCTQNTLTKPVASLKSSDSASALIQISDSGSQLGVVTVDLSSLLISNVVCPGA